jgi:hypothetical protein
MAYSAQETGALPALKLNLGGAGWMERLLPFASSFFLPRLELQTRSDDFPPWTNYWRFHESRNYFA